MSLQSTQMLSEDTPQTLFQQVGEAAWLRRIIARAQAMGRLQALFDQECPLELMGQCWVIAVRGTSLLVGVANAGLASQLQFRSREVLVSLHKYPEFAELKKLHVKINAEDARIAKK